MIFIAASVREWLHTPDGYLRSEIRGLADYQAERLQSSLGTLRQYGFSEETADATGTRSTLVKFFPKHQPRNLSGATPSEFLSEMDRLCKEAMKDFEGFWPVVLIREGPRVFPNDR